MKKLYEVIFVDEYNNFLLLGWFSDLDNAIESINKQLSVYGKGKYQLENGDLKEYLGTINICFGMDLPYFFTEKMGDSFENEIYRELNSCQIRGFVYEFNNLDYEIVKKIFCKNN